MATENQGSTLKKGVASLLGSDKFSDMTIICRDKVFRAHQAVICTQSEFFDKACTIDFKEKKEGKIDLSEDEPLAVEAVLEYLYKSDYTRLTDDNASALVLHVHVYQLAHMYDIEELKGVSAALFEKAAENNWNSPAFPLAIREIYDHPEGDDRALRNLAVEKAMLHVEELLEDDDGEFARTMSAFGDFGKDLCRASFKGTGTGRDMVLYQCQSNCNVYWKIGLLTASKAFKKNALCPRCRRHMNRPDEPEFSIIFYNSECRGCNKAMSNNNWRSEQNFHCPSCDQRNNFKVI